jgi:hypothetical protein
LSEPKIAKLVRIKRHLDAIFLETESWPSEDNGIRAALLAARERAKQSSEIIDHEIELQGLLAKKV